jgi:hypothetical protein
MKNSLDVKIEENWEEKKLRDPFSLSGILKKIKFGLKFKSSNVDQIGQSKWLQHDEDNCPRSIFLYLYSLLIYNLKLVVYHY